MGSFFLIIIFALQYMFIQISSQTWASLSFVPPGWGANSSQNFRSCALSGHKQRCWTVLSELRYKVAYNPNTFFLNWKQRSAEKAVEDALQFNKMCVAGVWAKTAKRYFVNGFLLQRFFWNFSCIFIMSSNADTRNFSKKYQQNFVLDAIFFEH